MVKMGTFKGIPVYMTLRVEEIDNDKEVFYALGDKLVYHGHVLGKLEGKNLLNFDEQKFRLISEIEKNKRENRGIAEMLGDVTGVKEEKTAETRPQEEEKPEYEVPETDCGKSLVDDFMASWRDNIDSEVAKLQASMKVMEEEVRARY